MLLQNFYRLVQGKSEKVQVFATRLEEALSQIHCHFPHLIGEGEVEHHLRHRFFYGMVKPLQDNVQ